MLLITYVILLVLSNYITKNDNIKYEDEIMINVDDFDKIKMTFGTIIGFLLIKEQTRL